LDGVVIDRKFADHEIPNRNPNIQKFVLNYLEERILPTSGEVISATRNLLETLVPMGQAKIEVVAQHLHMHPRTQQRRLNEHGCSFSQLLEEKRRMMAERLLRDGKIPLSNIASYLGSPSRVHSTMFSAAGTANRPRNGPSGLPKRRANSVSPDSNILSPAIN
jgi:AraC-like DNA-binding protein